MKIEPRRTLRYYLLRFVRLKGEPRFLARGFAIGVFIGITPTIPLHTVAILALTILFRSSKLAGLLASWLVSNPLTFFPQYYLSWRLGTFLTGKTISWEKVRQIMQMISDGSGFTEILHAISRLGWDAVITMVTGGCLLALPVAVIGYFAALYLLTIMNRKRLQKQILNNF